MARRGGGGRFVCRGRVPGCHAGGTGDGSGDGSGPSTSYAAAASGAEMTWRSQPPPPRAGPLAWLHGVGRGATGGLTLASLTTSASQRFAALSTPAPRLSIGGLPHDPLFEAHQALCAALYEWHKQKHKVFPRPCAVCGSNQFMVDRGDGVTLFESRPWACDQCAAWTHLGCLGAHHLEDVPCKPFFHAPPCRQLYLRLEATAARGPMPTGVPGLSWCLMTDIDHRKFRAAAALLAEQEAEREAARAAAAKPGRQGTKGAAGEEEEGKEGRAPAAISSLAELGLSEERGSMAAVYAILGQAFPPEVFEGFGEEGREYDGGKYAALLLRDGSPVCAATLNFWGPSAVQLALLATLPSERGRKHAATLLEAVEGYAFLLGAQQVFAQPRRSMLDMFVRRLGWEVAHPREVAALHEAMPLAYYDCAVVRKLAPA